MTDLRSAPVPPVAADDHLRGEPDARLVIVYADFTCPRCALAAQRLAGQPLRVVFRHFALEAKDRRAIPVARAAEAAAEQGRFWAMHDALYADAGHLDDPHLWERARQLGLDLERFDADRRSAGLAQRVRAQVYGAIRAGVALTPTLFVDGIAHPGVPAAEFVQDLLAGPARPASGARDPGAAAGPAAPRRSIIYDGQVRIEKTRHEPPTDGRTGRQQHEQQRGYPGLGGDRR